jgi:glycosyltransferase involved in cell wall biosynthesis
MLVHSAVDCGTFHRALPLARHLVKRGHEVTLFTGAAKRLRSRRKTIEGVSVKESFDLFPRRARESGFSPLDVVTRLRLLREQRCDLIHCFDHRPAVSFPGLMLARRQRVPCIFDWGDLWGAGGIATERPWPLRISVGLADQWLEEKILGRADALTVINSALRDRARARFSCPIHLMAVGANSDLIQPLSKRESRRHFGLPEDASIAAHTGLAPYDAQYLARSFVELAKNHPGTLLVLTGRAFPILKRVAAEAGLSHQLISLGMLDLDARVRAMACADVLLLPYTNRSVNRFRYPNKLGDYLAAGRPIVTNFTGDLGRLVADERVGLIAEDTPESFARAVKRLFNDEQLRDELGRRARELAETKLDWRFFAADLERFYESTLARFN